MIYGLFRVCWLFYCTFVQFISSDIYPVARISQYLSSSHSSMSSAQNTQFKPNNYTKLINLLLSTFLHPNSSNLKDFYLELNKFNLRNPLELPKVVDAEKNELQSGKLAFERLKYPPSRSFPRRYTHSRCSSQSKQRFHSAVSANIFYAEHLSSAIFFFITTRDSKM